MPELPEVEILVRHLDPLLRDRAIRAVTVHRKRILRPTTALALATRLTDACFEGVERRAKYLIFHLRKGPAASPTRFQLLGHLGMTGRMYLQSAEDPLPRHAAVSFDLGRSRFVFEDTRQFGRLTLDLSSLGGLGPEPMGPHFDLPGFAARLKRSAQPVKVRLMDPSLVVGVGNIYASEILHDAGISPRKTSRRLSRPQVARLHASIRKVLHEAVERGSTLPLDFGGGGRGRDALFYHGVRPEDRGRYEERLEVYDRAGLPCRKCGTAIRRIVQAARSTYFCAQCQRDS